MLEIRLQGTANDLKWLKNSEAVRFARGYKAFCRPRRSKKVFYVSDIRKILFLKKICLFKRRLVLDNKREYSEMNGE